MESARGCDSRSALYLSGTTITDKHELESRGLLLSHRVWVTVVDEATMSVRMC